MDILEEEIRCAVKRVCYKAQQKICIKSRFQKDNSKRKIIDRHMHRVTEVSISEAKKRKERQEDDKKTKVGNARLFSRCL